jgi:hypothetical protein
LEVEALHALDEMRQIQSVLEARRRNQAIAYYQPHAKQRAFHLSPKRVRSAIGGNRSGKTHLAIHEAAAHTIGYRPWIPKGQPGRIVMVNDGHGGRKTIRMPNKGLIVGESFGTLNKVQIPKLIGDPDDGQPGVFPTSELRAKNPTTKNQQGVIDTVYGKKGQRIHLMSYDQDVKLFEGMDFDWVMLDEPPPENIWKAIYRGATDRAAPVWFSCTPLSEPWMHEDIICDPAHFVVCMSTYDNVHIPKANIDEFARKLTKEEYEVRILGKFAHLSGLVYKGYDPDIHHLERSEVTLEPDWGYGMHVDPHPRKPHRAVWVAARPDDTYLQIGELENKHPKNLTSAFAKAIKRYERDVLGLTENDIDVRLIDPLAKTPGTTERGITILEEFSEFGLDFEVGSKNRDTGISLMRERLNSDPEQGIRPTFYMFSDLEGTHREFKNYVFKEHKTKSAIADNDVSGEIRKKNDDYIEGLHRICLYGLEAKGPDDYNQQGYGDSETDQPSAGY